MDSTFFCSTCFRHKPIAAQTVHKRSGRLMCRPCVEARDVKVEAARKGTAPSAKTVAGQRKRTTKALFFHLHSIGEL